MNVSWQQKILFKLFFNIFLTILFVLLGYVFSNKFNFFIFSLILFLFNKPKYILSPRNIIFGYYILWYGLAPVFAERYENIDYNNFIVIKANTMLFLTYSISLTVSMLIETKFENINHNYNHLETNKISSIKLYSVLILSILFFILYILKSGGFFYWINNLDRAFLTREGAGLYYLGFILSFPLFIYFFKIKYRETKLLNFYLISLILVLTPFIGSKQKIIYIVFLIFSSNIMKRKMNVFLAMGLIVPAVFLFVLGNYFRNSSWMKLEDVMAYSFNYFDTFDSILLFLNNNHQPLEIISVILPLNKIKNLFSGKDDFFDMSAYYTNIYFPSAWDIRATVQFPIEVDLYLSFGYWFGILPLIFFVGLYSIIFVNMLSSRKLVYGFIWFYLFFYMLSHFRGGIFLWTDLYVYFYLIVVYYLFKNVEYKVEK